MNFRCIYEPNICCFSAKYAALNRKSKLVGMRAIFQLYSGREWFKRHGTRNKGMWWVGTDNFASGLLKITKTTFMMSCYTGFFNVRRGWQSLNTGPRFYLLKHMESKYILHIRYISHAHGNSSTWRKVVCNLYLWLNG